MDQLLKEFEEYIAGVWVNKRYDLILGIEPEYGFSFIDKTKNPKTSISGKYFIVPHNEYHHPILRLTWQGNPTMLAQDYIITELSASGILTISHDGVKLQFFNQRPDLYESSNQSTP